MELTSEMQSPKQFPSYCLTFDMGHKNVQKIRQEHELESQILL